MDRNPGSGVAERRKPTPQESEVTSVLTILRGWGATGRTQAQSGSDSVPEQEAPQAGSGPFWMECCPFLALVITSF